MAGVLHYEHLTCVVYLRYFCLKIVAVLASILLVEGWEILLGFEYFIHTRRVR